MGELRSSYRFLVPELVGAGYTVVTTDLRGHGDSDTTFTRYGDVETASDIEALLRELGRPAVVVGNSLAAGSAVIVGAEHPNLVNGLVLVGPFVRNPSVSSLTRAILRVLMAPVWVASVWKAYMPSLYAGQKPVDFLQYRESVQASLRRPSYGRAFSMTTKADHAPAESRLGDVTAPVLVVMGSRDPDFKDPDGEARWIANILNAEVVMVPEAGHYPQSQQPQITADAVLNFLKTAVHHA
jgi:pimeloyl-ACP methyl ester carboxylesterase